MPSHNSPRKEMRKSKKRRLSNRHYAATTRNLIKKLKNTKDKKEAADLYPKVSSEIDKLAKRNIIHDKKAANLKSKLTKLVNGLQKSKPETKPESKSKSKPESKPENKPENKPA